MLLYTNSTGIIKFKETLTAQKNPGICKIFNPGLLFNLQFLTCGLGQECIDISPHFCPWAGSRSAPLFLITSGWSDARLPIIAYPPVIGEDDNIVAELVMLHHAQEDLGLKLEYWGP